jgi:beta-lactamase class A
MPGLWTSAAIAASFGVSIGLVAGFKALNAESIGALPLKKPDAAMEAASGDAALAQYQAAVALANQAIATSRTARSTRDDTHYLELVQHERKLWAAVLAKMASIPTESPLHQLANDKQAAYQQMLSAAEAKLVASNRTVIRDTIQAVGKEPSLVHITLCQLDRPALAATNSKTASTSGATTAGTVAETSASRSVVQKVGVQETGVQKAGAQKIARSRSFPPSPASSAVVQPALNQSDSSRLQASQPSKTSHRFFSFLAADTPNGQAVAPSVAEPLASARSEARSEARSVAQALSPTRADQPAFNASDSLRCRHHQGDQLMASPASLIKLPIAVALMAKIEEENLSLSDKIFIEPSNFTENAGGATMEIGKEYALREVMAQMIQESDNIATNQLIDYLGFDYINQTLKKMGYTQTVVGHKLVGKEAMPANFGTGINQATTHEITAMMAHLYSANRPGDQEIIKALSSQQDRDLGYAAVKEMGSDMGSQVKWLGEKTGQNDRVLATTLLLEIGPERYALTVALDNDSDVYGLHQLISRIANHLEKGVPLVDHSTLALVGPKKDI